MHVLDVKRDPFMFYIWKVIHSCFHLWSVACTTRCTLKWNMIPSSFRHQTWFIHVSHMGRGSFMFSHLTFCVYDTMHSDMKHDSFMFQVSHVIHSCFRIWRFAFTTRYNQIWNVIHSCLRYETWFIHVSDIKRDSSMFSRLSFWVYDTMHSDMRHDSVKLEIWNAIHSCFTFEMRCTRMWDMIHACFRCETCFVQPLWDEMIHILYVVVSERQQERCVDMQHDSHLICYRYETSYLIDMKPHIL